MTDFPYPDEMFEEAERREREVQENIERAIELDKEIEGRESLKLFNNHGGTTNDQ